MTDLQLNEALNKSIKNIETAVTSVMDIDYHFIQKYDNDLLTTALYILVDKRQQLYSLRERWNNAKV